MPLLSVFALKYLSPLESSHQTASVCIDSSYLLPNKAPVNHKREGPSSGVDWKQGTFQLFLPLDLEPRKVSRVREIPSTTHVVVCLNTSKMKPSSPLSLLFFLQLASATPLPETLFPSDCHYTSCAGFRSALISSKPNTPPTRLTNPHFPTHQLSSPDTLDAESFDNHPVSPSKDTIPSVALTSNRPLSSSFLLSLTNPASSPSIQKPPHGTASEGSLASKPTSALPHLRKEDAKRYWASLRPASGRKGEAVESDGPHRTVQLCGTSEFSTEHYVSFHGVRLARDYSDLMVVGIVVLFLVAVVALELVERIENVSRLFGARRTRRGQIYLEDDETVAFIVKKPISLQADPLHYQISTGEYQNEKEAFQ